MSNCECEQKCDSHPNKNCEEVAEIPVKTDKGLFTMCVKCASKMMQYQGLQYRVNVRVYDKLIYKGLVK